MIGRGGKSIRSFLIVAITTLATIGAPSEARPEPPGDRTGPAVPEQKPTAPRPEPLPRTPPKEPAEALRSFRTLHGFRMDLLAAEPIVTDPVAGAYDEDGRLYVVEMSDYPYTDKKNDRPFA